MGKLSTHVLDTVHGVPAQNVKLQLFRLEGAQRTLLHETRTNLDGRCDAPLLEGASFTRGTYELVFEAGDYFAGKGVTLPEPRFVDQVVLRFGIAHPEQNYHVPLVVTPWTWSTYRGS
ncbi:hydroxyisourate hydrolase [Castellaniella sp.]|uniref:hydroxyisourate hydrolase n=1 Tax=Castellaniella sp. TaxID=1955812 RepID=UPI003563079C